jgi:hypothetical protein
MEIKFSTSSLKLKIENSLFINRDATFLKKRSLNKGYCRRPNRKFPQIKLLQNMMLRGPPIALGAPNLEGPRGIFPTSLYGQSAPVGYHNIDIIL